MTASGSGGAYRLASPRSLFSHTCRLHSFPPQQRATTQAPVTDSAPCIVALEKKRLSPYSIVVCTVASAWERRSLSQRSAANISGSQHIKITAPLLLARTDLVPRLKRPVCARSVTLNKSISNTTPSYYPEEVRNIAHVDYSGVVVAWSVLATHATYALTGSWLRSWLRICLGSHSNIWHCCRSLRYAGT